MCADTFPWSVDAAAAPDSVHSGLGERFRDAAVAVGILPQGIP